MLIVQNISKAYKRYPRKHGRMAEWLGFGTRHEKVWVLQDISFQVDSGQAMGIIGVNGAGKSTILKIITGTTRPTSGSIHVQGGVSALLELGMGFNPDFTGRHNCVMTGQLHGLKTREIEQLIPSIATFADIGEYFDQPVRVYSSGMQIRLAFALATARRPDILIVDEALSVGDAAFQRKCYRRIEDFLRAGTTLLFVSHDIETVKRLCHRAVYFSQGRVRALGPSKEVCDQYEKDIFGGGLPDPGNSSANKSSDPEDGTIDPGLISNCEVAYGDGRAIIEDIRLEDSSGGRANVFPAGMDIQVCFTVRVNESLSNPVFAMMVKTCEGISIYGTDTEQLDINTGTIKNSTSLQVVFLLRNCLAPGTYYLNCGIRDPLKDENMFIHRRVDALMFRVIPGQLTTTASGIVDMQAKCTLL